MGICTASRWPIKNCVAWLEKLAIPLREAGLEVDVSVRSSGLPADELLLAASEVAADLLVIGSRGRNVLAKLFLGSVASTVLQKTTIPVLLEWVEPTADATQQQCEAVCIDTLRHVMLATDLSPSAGEAAAIHLAAKAEQADCVFVAETPDDETSLATSHAQTARKKSFN